MNQTIVTKGKLLGIGLKKNAKMRKGNSALGYFDLNGKTIIPYNLKHYLRIITNVSSKEDRGSWIPKVSRRVVINATTPPSWTDSGSKEVSKKTSLNVPSVPHMKHCSNLRFKLEERLQSLGIEIFRSEGKDFENFNTSFDSSSETRRKGVEKKGVLGARSPENLSFPNKQSFFELPWIVTAGNRASSLKSLRQLSNKATWPDTQDIQLHKGSSILPHEIKKERFQVSTWNWLSWSIKNNNVVTGRIARSLQRAGICVLIGGFTAFLPYKEYSIRNKIICAKEAELQSFQILNLKKSNLNCVLSKDRVTYKYDRSWKS